ncbi:hypothetical protein Ddc_14772 [Ditylenchus destructor]|nr:hypothetical protein Ddc_14772 [Ditylenchus destructor]
MSSLPNEMVSKITNFLPNSGITDLMLTSRNFNALVTPRLRKIDEGIVPDPAHEWVSQSNLKQYEPIGSAAKKRMRAVFEKDEDELLNCLRRPGYSKVPLQRFKEKMSLQRFDDAIFLRILSTLLLNPEFRKKIIENRSSGVPKALVTLALNLELGGSEAKHRAKDVFERMCKRELNVEVMALKEIMSLERFDDATFLRILSALVASPKFCQEYNVSKDMSGDIQFRSIMHFTFM